MFLWKLDQLMDVLTTDGLSQKALFGYTFISTVFLQLMLEMMIHLPDEPSSIAGIISVLNIVMVGAGVYYCYFCNGKDVGVNFLERFVSLNVVISIRQIVFIILPAIVVYTLCYAMFIYNNGAGADTTLIDNALEYFLVLWVAYFYFVIGRCMNKIAHRTK